MIEDLIKDISQKFLLDPLVVKAVVITESAMRLWSYRYEPYYVYLVSPREFAINNQISYDSEVSLQKTSIGLMHPMGGVCREYGFQEELSKIFQPELSLYYGCMHLQKKAQKYGSDPADMYAAYNAGGVHKTPGGFYVNQQNVDRFMQNLRKLTV